MAGLSITLAPAVGATGLAGAPAMAGRAPFPDPVEVVPAHSGGVVAVSLPFASPGMPVSQRFAESGDFQRWNVIEFGAGTGVFLIQSVAAGLVLDVAGGSTAAGAGLVINPWAATLSQLWVVVPLVPGFPFDLLINANSGQVMDVAGASQLPAPMVQWPWHGGLNQIFAM